MAEQKEKIVPIFIEEEMRSSYIDYSMSVIVSRALPDVRDGLKPVHRRVLYAMLDLGLRPSSSYKKSARIVGEVLGKYHPHGDAAVYDAMVRMVQDFSLRYPLVDGQGNFGSVDGDAPAAMRYTEARLAAIAEEILRDLEKDTVPFVPNFDDTLKEPAILPSLLPALLVNGSSGIAVGMATNMPPHNLNEVIDALVALIEKPELKPIDFKKYIKGPDFPTGALIVGDEEIDSYFKTGRGKLAVRAKVHTEDVNGRPRIVVNEIPYQVNKTSLIERVADLVRDKKIEGIYDIRDESDREGMRIVFELRKEADAEFILKELFKHSQLQTTFGVIMLALVDGQPQVLNIKQILAEFIKFRHDIVLRRIKYDLDKAEKRAHILEGLKIAIDNIDEIIALIKKSKDVDTARSGLIKRFRLSEIQAQAILDMRLQRLTGLERKKIEDEYLELIKLIQKLKSLLNSKPLRMQLVKQELLALKEKYGDNRRTQIITKVGGGETLKEMVSEEEVLVAITAMGNIMRFPLSEFDNLKDKIKNELGRDGVRYLFRSVNSHFVLLFGSSGTAYVLRTSFIPLSTSLESFTPVTRLLQLDREETFVDCYEVDKFIENRYIFLSTRNGFVKRIRLADFSKVKAGGSVVIALRDDDKLVSANQTGGQQEVVMATAEGRCIRFAEEEVREMGLSAGGIRGMDLERKDVVVAVVALQAGKAKTTIATLTNLGFGKRSELDEYSTTHRGGKGIVNYKTSPKVGRVTRILEVRESDLIVWLSKKGKQKRLKAKEIKTMGRATQGAAVAALKQGDEIVDVFILTTDSETKL